MKTKTIEEILSYFRSLDIKLWADGDRLRYSAPKGRLTPSLRAQLQEHKAEILNFLLRAKSISRYTLEPIKSIPRDGELPLSFAQQRLWFLDQLEGQSASYNMPAALCLTGNLNLKALEMSVNEIIKRHEILRTNFSMVNKSAVQTIAPSQTAILPVIDWQALTEAEQEIEVQKLAIEEAQRPFDLAHDLLVRVTLLRLNQQSHVLLVTMHHIISDGWSIGIFIRELSLLYEAFSRGEPSPLPELSIQYADFAHWQRQWLQGEVLDTQLNYWQQQLAGAPPLLELPTDRPRPTVKTSRGGKERFQVSNDLMQKLKALCQKSGSTLFMTLLAAFKILLSRYSSQEDLVVGSPIANRNRSEIEPLIGFFVNNLVLRTDLSGNPTFSELLERVRQVTLDAYAHQDIPFEQLVEELQPERSLSHSPLFQVMFVLQNAPIGKLELPGLTITSLEIDNATPDVDLTLFMEETESGLTGELEYNSDLFERMTIKQMAGHFQTLLSAIALEPEQRIEQLPLLSQEEQHQLLVELNSTGVEYPTDKCFPQLFEEQVERTPDAVAVVKGEQKLTYQELNAGANYLARLLVEQGVGPDTIVALLTERNFDFLTAMLAVFKAGGAYLPFASHTPVDRLSQVLGQSQAPLVLTTKKFETVISQALAKLATDQRPQVLFVDELQQQPTDGSNLPVVCGPNNLAYVIYTSGSTGLPKGAMIEHQGMLNHLYAKVLELKLTEADTVAQTAPQSFDISVWQFLAPLLVGGRVQIFSDEVASDPVELLEQVESQKIAILEIVPSLLRMMLEEIARGASRELSCLRWLIPTGEALPPKLSRQWLEYYPHIPLLNAYGPTECSDDVTHYPIYQPPGEEVLNMPIGRPVANMQLYVLDGKLQPVPVGVPGELYVGGVGVGRGYLNDSQRTAPAFINNPFAPEPNARLYKTGDKVRYLRNGNLEFLGRLDYQVKLRGFRIELGEIEAVLAEHPGVTQVVVIAREDQPGNKRLIAYIIPNPEQEAAPSELRRFLKEKLPDYMVPSAFVRLEKIPLTPNGKVDRRALPAPDLSRSGLEVSFVAPRTPTEEVLANIWAEVLGIEQTQISIYDNFFELGGHSLLATQVISRLRQIFQVDLPLYRLFEEPTIANLAEHIDKSHWILQQIQAVPSALEEDREEIEL